MAAAVDTPRERRWLVPAGCLLAAAYLATRLAMLWRFPWYVDETTFASFARDVHGDLDQFFAAEIDKKGLLPSWLGAGLISAGVGPVTAMRVLAAAGAALAAVCGGVIVRRLYGLREGLLTAGADRPRAVLPRQRLGRHLRRDGHGPRGGGDHDRDPAGSAAAARLGARPRRRHRRGRPHEADDMGGGGRDAVHALLLFDYASPLVRRRLLGRAGYCGSGRCPRLCNRIYRPPDPAVRQADAAARRITSHSARCSTTPARASFHGALQCRRWSGT